MECSEEQKKVVRLSYEEWTQLLGEAVREKLKSNGIEINGSKASLRMAGQEETPELYITFTTANKLLEESREEPAPQMGATEEIDEELDLELLSDSD